MDPLTAAPRLTPVHSSTVAAPTCLEADVGSGAVYGLTRAEADAILGRLCRGAELTDREV